VSFDSAQRNAQFAEKYSFTFPLLCDTTKAMAIAYGAAPDASARAASRTGVIIDPDGKILFWSASVNAKGFPDQALALIANQ
jgi:peroxiredoxin Q/BCP